MTLEERAEKICTGISFLSKADKANAIKAIVNALEVQDARYHNLWYVVSGWCELQTLHPGCSPGVKELQEALDAREP